MRKTFFVGMISLVAFITFQSASASDYDIYVNKASLSSSEDGSQENPFKTISAATTLAETKPSDQRKIYVANGVYDEPVVLNESVTLVGQDKNSTIINAHSNHYGIKINKSSTIINLTVSEGYTGIYVAAGAGAYIDNCKVSKTEKMGIEIARSTTSEIEKVTVKNCSISNGEGKGFYINKRKVSIEKNTIEKNDEEGIDIRSSVKGSIKKNTISKNGESGIEVVVGNSDLKIYDNKIKGNSASGISHQFYKDSKKLGSIELAKNKIQKNNNYGLQCATPSGGDEPKNYWTKSIDLKKNIFSRNDKDYAKRCRFQLALKK